MTPAQDVLMSRYPIAFISHAQKTRGGINADDEGVVGPMKQIEELKNRPPIGLCYDVVGTGSSRKLATNSVLWL
jgi:aconitate hydratase 2/2-methylisocitrate dehydratase